MICSNSSMDINKRKRHVLNKNRVSFERIFPLSEYLLELLENEEEFDSASSPYSFQVSKFTVYHDDSNGNEMIRFVDSLILSACDQDAKNLWVQYIRNWSRFGWQKTRFVHAEDKYRAFLLRQLKEQASLNIQEKPSPPTSSKSSSSSSGGGSASGRRRFYRIATRTINMTNHVSSSSWFHARVTRVNVGG
jgi:hypothetical protein